MIETRIEESKLTAAFDIRNPYCYLALGPTREIGRDFEIKINWLPAACQPLNAPTEPGPDDDRGVLHRRFRAQSFAREIAVYADTAGLDIREYYRTADADAANSAWLWIRENHPQKLDVFLDAAFAAYWAVRLDASSDEQIARLMGGLGLDADEFAAWRADGGDASRDALQSELAELGVLRMPAFIMKDEIFIGRQHLPMIRWILAGKKGAGPI